jgi:hypothetical protein
VIVRYHDRLDWMKWYIDKKISTILYQKTNFKYNESFNPMEYNNELLHIQTKYKQTNVITQFKQDETKLHSIATLPYTVGRECTGYLGKQIKQTNQQINTN